MHGWTGRILRVDLSRGTHRVESTRADWARSFVGGRGLAVKYFSEEVDPAVNPFSADNKLIFATGPLTGTSVSCGARYMVVTKAALNGTLTTSNSGGHWGPELKFAGYDMVIVEGRASRPVYIWIFDDVVEIRDAGSLWGKSTWDTEDWIRDETGVADAKIASIGPAGEHLVRFACIMNDKHRAAGRNGVGAVMGSKQLKAIAVRGTGSVSIARPADFLHTHWLKKSKLKGAPVTGEGLPALGTAVLVHVINESGAMPTKNFQYGRMRPEETGSDAENISGEQLKARNTIRNKACFACTIACGRVTEVSDAGRTRHQVTTSPHNWKIAGEGPEYENTWSLGAATNVDDLDAILKATFMCNEYGMDPISFGSTLAAAMELYEVGAIGDADLAAGPTIPLRFGSADALVAMTEATAFRRGFGNELAEGSKRMCERYGHPEFFMGSKGQEFPAYDPRAVQGMGLGYATSNRGGCHLRGYTLASEILGIPVKTDPSATAGKAALSKAFQDTNAAFDATGTCIFLTFGIGIEDQLPELVAATGVDYTVESLLEVGERIFNLERRWLLDAGFSAADDTLPQRLLKQAIPHGPTRGQVSRLSEMLPEYYQLRGWTERGEPTPGKLAALGL